MDVLLIVLFGALGAVVASFVGVLVERVHTGRAWVRSRSRCNSCNRLLGSLDLIPVISWVISSGCCRTCGCRVPVRYLIAESVAALLFVGAYLSVGLTLPLPFLLLALGALLFIVLYDLRHTIVLPEASFLLLVTSLAVAYLESATLGDFGYTLLVAGIIGICFLLLHVCSKGKAMGLGDAPVAFSLSLLTGIYAITGLLCSFWIGGVYGAVVLVRRRGGSKMNSEVPFVPFLAAGFLLAYFLKWNLFLW